MESISYYFVIYISIIKKYEKTYGLFLFLKRHPAGQFKNVNDLDEIIFQVCEALLST